MQTKESVKNEFKRVVALNSKELQEKLGPHLVDFAKAINDLNNTFEAIKKEVVSDKLNKN